MTIRYSSKLMLKILFVIWSFFVLSYLHKINYFSFSIEKVLPSITLGIYRGDPLLQGDTVTIDYQSPYKKLGTIGIKFTTFYRINSDTLRFKIKEVDKNDWYYQHDYKVDQFQQGKVFPFGFPIIEDSARRKYVVQIESLNGIPDNSVAITSPLDHSVIAKHVFTQKQLLSDVKLLLYFGFHKLIFFVSDPEFLIHLLLYSLPLFYYLVYALVGFSMGAFSAAIFLSVFFDVLFIKGHSAFFILSVIFGWGLMTWHHKVESRVTSSVFVAIFSLSPILYLFGQAELGDKVAVWAYMFLAFSMSQLISEIKLRSNNLILINDYWHDLVVEGRNMGLFIYLVIVGEISVAAERIRLGVGVSRIEISDLIKGVNMSRVEISDSIKSNTGQIVRAGIGKTKATPELIALVVYRWETPMVKTYIYTSRFLAHLIVLSVKAVGGMVRYGPFALFGWLVWYTLDQVKGYLNFFREFFVQNQNDHFWNQIGNDIVSIYLVVLIIFLFLLFQDRLNLRRKTLVGIVILYFCTIIIQTVFHRSTPYRDDLKIWSVGPSETAEPWVDVTITGRNFGEMPFIGKVYIDGVEQRIMKWNKKEIIFRTNPLTTRSGRLAVRGYSKAVSNAVTFTYTGNR